MYDRYPSEFPCRIVLCDNYRSHSAIVKFTSELFYDNRLKAVGRNDQHSEFFPLTFRVAKGIISKHTVALFVAHLLNTIIPFCHV